MSTVLACHSNLFIYLGESGLLLFTVVSRDSQLSDIYLFIYKLSMYTHFVFVSICHRSTNTARVIFTEIL
jgi:hypothetical protein